MKGKWFTPDQVTAYEHDRNPPEPRLQLTTSVDRAQTYSMRPFIYTANPARVVFGSGTIKQLPDEVKRLGLKRPLVLSTPEQTGHASNVESLLKDAGIESAGQFNGATMHTPLDVTEKALAFANERKVDGVIAIGGGSTIGLGKAIALRTDMPQIVIPTTCEPFLLVNTQKC